MVVESPGSESQELVLEQSVSCRNCGYPVQLNYCPKCGQHVADHNTKLWHFVAEFMEEFVRFDSKFLRTVIPLMIRPGFLTQEWVKGKRVRYITPLKIYITLSAIAFLVISYQVGQSANSNFDLVHVDTSAKGDLPTVKTEGPIADFVRDSAYSFGKVDQRLLVKEFLSHLPTATILMVPFAAMMFAVLYLRRSKYYVEHLVFTLHFGAFSFLALTLAFVIPGDAVGGIAYLWVAGYLFFAMKRNYSQGWIKTGFKWLIFGFSYTFLIAFVLVITALIAARSTKELTKEQPKPAITKTSKGDEPLSKAKSTAKSTGLPAKTTEPVKKTLSLK